MKITLRNGFAIVGSVACAAWSTTAIAQSCTAFNEAPMLAANVASGALPPVADRLPAEPMVAPVAEHVAMARRKRYSTPVRSSLQQPRIWACLMFCAGLPTIR